MWIDSTGAVHTVWVPPAAVLGEEAVADLQGLPADVAAALVDALDGAYEAVESSAVAEGTGLTGPVDLTEDMVDQLPYPPTPQPWRLGEPTRVVEDVLTHLRTVPAQWRLETLEAIADVLTPDMDDAEVDAAFERHASDP